MSNTALYTGALKAVRQPVGSGPTTQRLPQVVERTYEIPESQQDSARAWMEEANENSPCNLKIAGTVMFVRDGSEGIETFMTYRVKSPMGRLAFPGGLATESDVAHHQWFGPTDAQWAAKTGGENPVQARAAVTAAIREVFEETGLLMAGSDETSTVESLNAHETMAVRQMISSQQKDFIQYLEKRGLKMRTDLLKPVAHWHSPDYFHKRYDLHYFAAAVPIGQKITLLEGKGIWGDWLPVKRTLELRERTVLGDTVGQEDTVGKTLEELVNPAVMCLLETMAKSPSAIAFLSQKRAVTIVKPDIKMQTDGTCYLSFSQTPNRPVTRNFTARSYTL